MTPSQKAQSLLNKINKPSRFAQDDFHLKETETKLGTGLDCVIIKGNSRPGVEESDKADVGIRTNIDGPGNPGFTFSPNGSEIRPGQGLDVRSHFTQIRFNGQQINPLAEFIPSTAAMPVLMIITPPPVTDVLPFMDLLF